MERRIGNGHSALRRGRVSVSGAVYLVTTVVRDRAPAFADREAAKAVCRLHGVPRVFLDATVLAWVLMPDHWHGVIELGADAPLSRVIQNFKSLSARHVQRVLGAAGPFWQSAFHDRALRDEAEWIAATCYVRENPVRAGLCRVAADYPYAGDVSRKSGWS